MASLHVTEVHTQKVQAIKDAFSQVFQTKFECTCGESFFESQMLMNHVMTKHTSQVGVKIVQQTFEVFQCNFCGECLQTKDFATSHVKEKHFVQESLGSNQDRKRNYESSLEDKENVEIKVSKLS